MRVPAWAWIVGGLLFAFGVLFFVQTKDPMILVMAVFSGAIVLGIGLLVAAAASGALGGGVKVRCRACAALGPEGAAYCGSCGERL